MVSALDWSVTPGSNTTIGGIANGNTMNPANLDDLSRAIAAGVKSALLDMGGATATTGSADAYLWASNGMVTSLINGAMISVKANFSNTGAATLAVDALGVKKIRKFTVAGEAALAANDMLSGGHYILQYNSAADSASGAWVLVNPASPAFGSPITVSVAGVTAQFINTTDSASVQVVRFEGDRATMADADEAYVSLMLSNDGGTQTEFARFGWTAVDVNAGTSVDGSLFWSVTTAGSLAKELVLTGTALAPFTNDGLALGISGTAFSDAYFASGAVIDFAAGNVVVTHSSGILTMGTGEMRITTPGTNTASVVTVGGTQTLTAKTLTAPVLTNYISFPATQSASAGANDLDDYEEGSFTPTYKAYTVDFTSVTCSTQTGRYTKIGRLVVGTVHLVTSDINKGSASGSLGIDGNVFTPALAQQSCFIGYSQNFATNQPTAGRVFSTSTGIFLTYRTAANGASSALTLTDITDGAGAGRHEVILTYIFIV